MRLGFIITRHINNEITNKYWNEAYLCIRKHWSDTIVFIDDNSDKNYLKRIYHMENIIEIDSEYIRRGELLGYYYFYHNKFFDKAIIIHDSVFINEKIDFESVKDIAFLWSFSSNIKHLHERDILRKSNNCSLEKLYDSNNWIGCFGVMSVITHTAMVEIYERYHMEKLLSLITNRSERMSLERIYALIVVDYLKGFPKIICGDIFQHQKYGTSFQKYLFLKKTKRISNINKVWTGR